jgi:DNA-binding transcriptional MocR family regulator
MIMQDELTKAMQWAISEGLAQLRRFFARYVLSRGINAPV